MSTFPLPLVRGTLDMFVLKFLSLQPTHAYVVSGLLKHQTGGALHVENAALHQAFRRLEARGWIEGRWDVSKNNRRVKLFSLTESGRKHFDAEAEYWFAYAHALIKVLETERPFLLKEEDR